MRDLSSPADPLLSYDRALAEGDTAAVTRLVQDMRCASTRWPTS
jgi:hypothetical protein